jgi:hypothetical protein
MRMKKESMTVKNTHDECQSDEFSEAAWIKQFGDIL